MPLNLGTFATFAIKGIKLVINLIIVLLYRFGNRGEFLGIGGTWNLNDYKNADVEIAGSGVMVGFIIYTAVVVIAFCFGTTKHKETMVEIIMNIVGTIMWIGVGAVALHFWIGWVPDHSYTTVDTPQQCGIAVGSLSIILAAIYLLDVVLTFLHILNADD